MDKIQSLLGTLEIYKDKSDKRLQWQDSRRTISSKQYFKVNQMYRDTNKSLEQCCIDCGMDYDTYQYYKQKYFPNSPKLSKKLTDKFVSNLYQKQSDTDQKIQDIKNGMKPSDFCDKWNVASSSYYYFIKKYNLPKNRWSKSNGKTMDNRDEKIQDIKNGMTRKEWKEKWGYKGNSMYTKLKKVLAESK